MKLTSLQIENVLGVKRASIHTDKGVIFVAGQNGAGKSSIGEAIRQAFTGEAKRVGLKKEYPALLHNGAAAGSVVAEFDTGAVALTLPDGKGTDFSCSPAMAICLEPHRFAAMDAKETRKFLFSLMGVKMSSAAIKERLIARKVDAAKADLVVPLLAAGFDSACTEAKARARDSKASWRTITGETYGGNKAEGWTCAGSATVRENTQIDIGPFDAQIEAKTKELGGLQAQHLAHAQAVEELEQAKEKAASIERIAAKLAADRKSLAEWAETLEETKAKASGEATEHALTCPHCSGLVVLNRGELHAYTPPTKQADLEAVANLPEHQKAHDLMARAVANGERDLAAANAAAQRAKDLEKSTSEYVSLGTLEGLSDEIDELKAKRAQAQALNQAARDADQKVAQAVQKTKQAADHHEDVKAWEEISDALAPDGIPAEFLAEAIKPFNEALAELSQVAGWPTVAIDNDMNITVGGRAYVMRSESEQWRADAIIAAAIAQRGPKFIMLDRFDVLDTQGRTDALYFLSDLDAAGVGALVMGTLKAVPAGLDALGIEGVWIEQGVIETREAATV